MVVACSWYFLVYGLSCLCCRGFFVMGENKVFKFDNVVIECNALCPLFFCGSDKCKLIEHFMKYTKLMKDGHTVSMF